ncbi:hypothetical protein HDV62DRAFT_198275 [Trichoderma sp. SZMC 28011]
MQMHAAGDSSLCVGTRAAAHWPPLVPGRFHDGRARERMGKVPRPAVAFGGAWEVQVLIPQHPRIRAAVDLCFHLISSRLVSSFKAQQQSLQALVSHRLIRRLVLSGLVLSCPLLRVLAASSHHRQHPLGFHHSLSCINPIAQHPATKEAQTAAPQAYFYSTAPLFSLLAASTTSWLISTSARLTSPCKRAQPYSTIDPSSELQSLSHKASSRPPIILFRAHIFNHKRLSSSEVSNKVPEKKNLTQANQPTKTESSLPGTIATLWSRASTVVSPSLL